MNTNTKTMPDFIYLTIPTEWLTTYHRLLKGIAEYGEDAIKDCDAACKGNNLYTIQCWNIFQSAIAARAIGDEKAANLMIDYINAQLDLLKIPSKIKIVLGNDGYLYCSDGINDEIRYLVGDAFTGYLYEHRFEGNNNKDYNIDDSGHLTETTNDE